MEALRLLDVVHDGPEIFIAKGHCRPVIMSLTFSTPEAQTDKLTARPFQVSCLYFSHG